jgi:SPP1 gp7 family putative phage head morphogenesis protein
MTAVDTSPAARRAFRRKLLAASSARHPRPLARPAPPNGVELAYTKILRDASRAMDDAIMATLRAEGLVRTDAIRDLVPLERPAINRITQAIARKLSAIASYQSLAGAIDKMASRLVEYSRSQWQAQLKGSLGITLGADPNLAPLVERFRARQGDLIVSLAKDKVARVKSVLREQGSDATVDDLADRIQEETGATESRARLIARTETTTFNSQLSIARHTAAGIKEFTWSTSNDERVRESHADLDGKVFAYSDPPLVDGERTLPGQTYNCRCSAIAILPTEEER